MDIAHPAAKMIVEVAKTQDEKWRRYNNGCCHCWELLKSRILLDQDVHATVIASGYKLAAEKAEEY